MAGIDKNHKRKINYLRVSVTDRCNLRCSYCMPPEGVENIPHTEILSYEEIVKLVEAGVDWGIDRVRLTGGEPLVRKGLPSLVNELNNLSGLKEISLTTNGTLLPRLARPLAAAGLDRVNISLDTLSGARFEQETGFDRLQQVKEGISAALSCLTPVKLNMVVRKGFNDDEILDFAALTVEKPLHVRFIEFMTTKAESIDQHGQFMSNGKVKATIAEEHRLKPVAGVTGEGPARYFRVPGARGTVGFISPVSDIFCSSCNRLRLTSTGELRPCLYSSETVELKKLVRGGAEKKDLRAGFEKASQLKPADRRQTGSSGLARNMSEIGG
ncbi:MAG: GTP 3',8-cyclase MoaA [Halanaerobiaceae bacterium]